MSGAEPDLYHVPYEDFLADTRAVAQSLTCGDWKPDFVVGVGRGGLAPAVYISHHLDLPMLSIDQSSRVPGFAEELLRKVAEKSATGTRLLFVDDINDSGATIETIRGVLADSGCNAANLRFAVLLDNRRSKARVDYAGRSIDRDTDKRWFVFPWEAEGSNRAIVDEALSNPERLA